MLKFIESIWLSTKLFFSKADCYFINNKKGYIKVKTRPIHFIYKNENYNFAIIHIPFEEIKILYIPDRTLLLNFSNETELHHWINTVLQLVEDEIILEDHFNSSLTIGHIEYCKTAPIDEILSNFKFEEHELNKTDNTINIVAHHNENLDDIITFIINTLRNISNSISIINDIYVIIGYGQITIKYGKRKLTKLIEKIKDTDIYMLFINDIKLIELIKNHNLLKKL